MVPSFLYRPVSWVVFLQFCWSTIWEAMSDFHWLNFRVFPYHFCQIHVISATIMSFSFINWKVTTVFFFPCVWPLLFLNIMKMACYRLPIPENNLKSLKTNKNKKQTKQHPSKMFLPSWVPGITFSLNICMCGFVVTKKKSHKQNQKKEENDAMKFDLTFKSIISCWESRRCCVVRLSLSEYIMFTCSSHTHPEILFLLLLLILLLMRLLVLAAQWAESDCRNDVMSLRFHWQKVYIS